jgi:hypothetical protein
MNSLSVKLLEYSIITIISGKEGEEVENKVNIKHR